MTEAHSDRALSWSLGLGALALVYRAWLTRIYWGHEEEDWGNLQMIRGILDNPLGQVETEHMPLFTWFSAAVSALAGDPQLGGEILAVCCGAGVVAITTWIGFRWFSPIVGVLGGLLLCFQPESALYSASPLRESLYTFLMMSGVLLVGGRRFPPGGAVLALAFLARFNIAFSILPALTLWIIQIERTPEGSVRLAFRGGRRGLIALGLVACTVGAWAIYYYLENETWNFWGGVVARNTGNAVTDLFVEERIRAVLGAVLGLLLVVLTSHAGWLVVPLAALGVVRLSRAPRHNEDAARWLRLCGLGTVGLLVLTALLSTYDWRHNLYWKWLTPTVPYLCLFAVHGGRILVDGIVSHPLVRRGSFLETVPPRVVGILLALVALGVTADGYRNETHRQITVSNDMYGTQVRIAQWLEEEWEAEAGVLTWSASIPAAYLQRKPSEIRVRSWNDESLPGDSPAELGRWLTEERIGLVIWYAEEGTGAREAAGFLESGQEQQLGPALLKPLVLEDDYGTIAYIVEAEGIALPAEIPPPEFFAGAAP
ncbi:MAG: hypothetical protein VX498_10660 [Myxococcota bacterium]|nr:hypothetical protein [Myxococcota bacterium]